jgi:hypothetical protein
MFFDPIEELQFAQNTNKRLDGGGSNEENIGYLISALNAPFKVTFQCDGECCKTNIRKLFLFNQIMKKYELHEIGIKRIIFFWIVFVNDINRDFIIQRQEEMDNLISVQRQRMTAYWKLNERMEKVRKQFNKNIQDVSDFNENNPNNPPLEVFTSMYEMDCSFYGNWEEYEEAIHEGMVMEKMQFDAVNLIFTKSHTKAFLIPYAPINEVNQPELSDFHLYCLVDNYRYAKLVKSGVKAIDSCTPYLRYDKRKCVFKFDRPPNVNDLELGKKKEDLYDTLINQYRSCFQGPDIPTRECLYLRQIQSFLLPVSHLLRACKARLVKEYEYLLYIDDGHGKNHVIVEKGNHSYRFKPAYIVIVNTSITYDVAYDNVLPILYDVGVPLHMHTFCSYCKKTVYDGDGALLGRSIEDLRTRKMPEKMTFKCSACHEVYYCGKRCQIADWSKSHKTMCIKLPLLKPNIVVK